MAATTQGPTVFRHLADYIALVQGEYPQAVQGSPLLLNSVNAAAVSQAESGGRAQVVSGQNTNGTYDIGLWQINSSHIGESFTDPAGPFTIQSSSWLQDPVNNLRAAYAISDGFTNWRPWCTAWSDGACGTKGGKPPPPGNLAPGSPAARAANSWAGGAAGGLNPPGSTGGGVNAPPNPGTGGYNPGKCLLSLGSLGCLLGDQAGHKVLGGLYILAGGVVVAAAVLVGLGKASGVTGAVGAVVGGPAGLVGGAVAAGGRRRADRREAAAVAQGRENERTAPRSYAGGRRSLGRTVDASELGDEEPF